MQDKLCCPCSPRNPLITRLQLTRSHVSVICERSSNFWVIAFVFDRLHTAVAVKPNKNVNTSDIFCVLYQNYQARLNRLNLTAYKFLGTGNRDIIDIAISFLSDIHFRTYVIESINTLTNISSSSWSRFLFLQDNGYASGAIIISTSPSTSLKPDESRRVSFHIWILPSSPPVTMTWFLHYAAQSIRKEKIDGQAHLIVG